MIPSDAHFWGQQVVQAYGEADGQIVAVPEGWSMVSRLNVTERALLWTEHSLIGFILNHPVLGDAVVTRGTMNLFDWLADVEVVVSLAGVDVGFETVYRGISLDGGQTLANWLKTRLAKPIGFYGHSMGASVATIAAKESYAATGVRPRLLTFASPRTLAIIEALELERALAPGSSRIANLPDLVPTEPLAILLRHVLDADYVDSSLFPSIGKSIVSRHCMATYLELLTPRVIPEVQPSDVLGTNGGAGEPVAALSHD